ncbi:hypothetical protein SDC9_108484 [bioreactor metagenome]|uniref:Uncharacterized protein n=1 Tax=bioreactor metagenome TaxID=1076179 RepID=A0A645BIQ8_9ZZZZ
MKKTKLSSYFIFISFFTLVTILVTIIQKSYSNLIDPINKVSTSSYEKIKNSQLDLDIIDEISKRSINFDENSLINNNSIPEASASSTTL